MQRKRMKSLKKYLHKKLVQLKTFAHFENGILSNKNLKRLKRKIKAVRIKFSKIKLFGLRIRGKDRICYKIPDSKDNVKRPKSPFDDMCHGTIVGMPSYHEKQQIDELQSWIENANKLQSFHDLFMQYLKERGYGVELSYSKFYKKIEMSKQVFSKIISEKNPIIPEKNNVFKIIIGLELPFDKAEELLEKAGFEFVNQKKFDMIIQFCIVKKIYDKYEIDEYLNYFGEKGLFFSSSDVKTE